MEKGREEGTRQKREKGKGDEWCGNGGGRAVDKSGRNRERRMRGGGGGESKRKHGILSSKSDIKRRNKSQLSSDLVLGRREKH